jgi:fimbrial chaperone protein
MFTKERAGSVVAVFALVLLGAGTASAATFRVSPVQLSLSVSATSGLLTLSNESQETLRFQLTAFRWDESEKGQMELLPTEEIAVFPTLLTLEAGKERKIRIGAATSLAASEKTYRVFVEELPPVERPGEAPAPSQIRVLTRMGIPIFLRPSKTESGGEIVDARFENARLSFLVRNSGNVHFMLQTIRVQATGAAGETILDKQDNGWYVLAGGGRQYDWPVPQSDCARVKSVRIEARTDSGVFETRVNAPSGACRESG